MTGVRVWVELLECWDGCDGDVPHQTTDDGSILRGHRCLICGHQWTSINYDGLGVTPHG